ncbi:nodulation protein NfeD [Streptosporangium sp. NPDC000396]|uniref:NfeD family protein n=1 Tax=Streptosporangium sp. NPDC000396 TaxID=3366185 RepID=UPI0036A596E6
MSRRLRLVTQVMALVWLALTFAPARADAATVLLTRVDGPITPVITHHVAQAVQEAERGGHRALLVELETPGGLVESMRGIVKTFLAAKVPIVVYVTPPGARAASAGALITLAAHVAAMAPATTIGAATPVSIGGQTPQPVDQKVVNDMAALAESIARQRGRDVTFARESVTKGRSITAETALQVKAIDLIAKDRGELLKALDGRQVKTAAGPVTLHTEGASVVETDLGPFRSLLQLIADPNIAFLLISLGTLGLIYELANPGVGLGGIIGGVLLILGLFALSVLPVNIAGVLLLVLALAMFAAEVLTPGVGVFGVGGAIALLAAGLLLFEDPAQVDLAVLLPTTAVLAAAVVFAGRLAWRARRARPVSGSELLLDREATVRNATGDPYTGRVFLDGTWWTVRSTGVLQEGHRVRVVGVDGLTLLVEPLEVAP